MVKKNYWRTTTQSKQEEKTLEGTAALYPSKWTIQSIQLKMLRYTDVGVFGECKHFLAADVYHWREMPQVSVLSQQNFCHDKHMFVMTNGCVMTKHIFCHDKYDPCCNK